MSIKLYNYIGLLYYGLAVFTLFGTILFLIEIFGGNV